jgi:hypothetical protein
MGYVAKKQTFKKVEETLDKHERQLISQNAALENQKNITLFFTQSNG